MRRLTRDNHNSVGDAGTVDIAIDVDAAYRRAVTRQDFM